jgi:hypothetical protein
LSYLAGDLLAVSAAADEVAAVGAVGIDPGDAFYDYEYVGVITGRPAALDQTAVPTGPTLFSVPRHRLFRPNYFDPIISTQLF